MDFFTQQAIKYVELQNRLTVSNFEDVLTMLYCYLRLIAGILRSRKLEFVYRLNILEGLYVVRKRAHREFSTRV